MLLPDTIWFEIAIVSMIFALGNILFGHFEEQTPKYRRVGKFILTLMVIVGLSTFLSRTISLIVLGLAFLPVIYIHGILLPRKGINGWTGEPKDKYYELRGWDKTKLTHNNEEK